MPAASLELGNCSRHSVDPFNMTNWKPAMAREVAATTSPAVCIHTAWCCKEVFLHPDQETSPNPASPASFQQGTGLSRLQPHCSWFQNRAMKHHQKYPRVLSEAVTHRLGCLWAVLPQRYLSSLQHNLCKTFSLLGTRKPAITPSRYCCRSA